MIGEGPTGADTICGAEGRGAASFYNVWQVRGLLISALLVTPRTAQCTRLFVFNCVQPPCAQLCSSRRVGPVSLGLVAAEPIP
jgi:hypothetical protein